jgi:starch phosphorylase
MQGKRCAWSSSTSSSPARCRTCCASAHAAPSRWTFHEKFAVQLNDTHPAIAVAELMRLLVDEHGWTGRPPGTSPANLRLHQPHAAAGSAGALAAAAVRQRAAAPSGDHLRDQRRFLDEVRLRFPATRTRIARMSLIDERRRALCAHGQSRLRRQPRHQRRRRAAHRTAQAKRAARLPRLWPEKFQNKTNGVTPRRFIAAGNPACRADQRALGPAGSRPRSQCAELEPWPTTPRSAVSAGAR